MATCGYLTDHKDHCNHLSQGRQLAAQVLAYRQAYPGRRVYLVGHSAGSAVVLAAADLLPPDSVDRIILLAPSVCESYDLRPALRTVRKSIEVFYSDEDWLILGMCMQIVGTAEGSCREAAGKCGFSPIVHSPGDAAFTVNCTSTPGTRWSNGAGTTEATTATTRPVFSGRMFCPCCVDLDPAGMQGVFSFVAFVPKKGFGYEPQ